MLTRLRTRTLVAVLALTAAACEEITDPDSGGSGSTSSSGSLSVGGSVSGLSGSSGQSRRYSFSSSGPVTVRLSGGSGDPDLFVRVGSQPSQSTYDCASRGSSTTESCTVGSGTVHVLIYGYSAYSGVTLSASSGSTSGSPTSPTSPSGSFVCPGTLPSGYQCVSRNGVQAPVRFNLPTLHGTWVDTSFEVCMTLNSSGTSSFRYRGSTESNRRWGALVSSTGALQPNSSTYYVYTGSSDAQIALLTWTGSGFAGFNFRRISCPY